MESCKSRTSFASRRESANNYSFTSIYSSFSDNDNTIVNRNSGRFSFSSNSDSNKRSEISDMEQIISDMEQVYIV